MSGKSAKLLNDVCVCACVCVCVYVCVCVCVYVYTYIYIYIYIPIITHCLGPTHVWKLCPRKYGPVHSNDKRGEGTVD